MELGLLPMNGPNTIPSPPSFTEPPKSGTVDARFGKFRVTLPAAVVLAVVSAVGTGLAVTKTSEKLDQNAEVERQVKERLAKEDDARRLRLLETRMSALEDQCHNALILQPKGSSP